MTSHLLLNIAMWHCSLMTYNCRFLSRKQMLLIHMPKSNPISTMFQSGVHQIVLSWTPRKRKSWLLVRAKIGSSFMNNKTTNLTFNQSIIRCWKWSLTFNNNNNEARNLGIIFDCNLNYLAHLKSTSKRCKKDLFAVSRIKKCLPQATTYVDSNSWSDSSA